jgi:hypothetical protein
MSPRTIMAEIDGNTVIVTVTEYMRPCSVIEQFRIPLQLWAILGASNLVSGRKTVMAYQVHSPVNTFQANRHETAGVTAK